MSDTVKLREAQMEVYEALHALADELDEHQKKLDKAKLSFSTTGAAGGIMTIVGLALISVTFGASIGFAIAGGVIGGLSATGSIGSIIADKVVTSKALKKSQEELIVLAAEEEKVQALLPRLIAQLNGEELEDLKNRIRGHEEINETVKEKVLQWIKSAEHYYVSIVLFTLGGFKTTPKVNENIITLSIAMSKTADTVKDFDGMAGATAHVANMGRAVGTVADAGIDVAKTAGKAAVPGAKIAGIATAGVGLAFDLGGMIFYSMKVHKQKPCEIAQKIRTVANLLHWENKSENDIPLICKE